MAREQSPKWIDDTFMQLVDRLAQESGFLDIWSANPASLRRVCERARVLLDEIVYADEEYRDRGLDRKTAALLEEYRLRVSLALQETQEKLVAQNKSVAHSVKRRRRPVAIRLSEGMPVLIQPLGLASV